jgi:hypothetical protein
MKKLLYFIVCFLILSSYCSAGHIEALLLKNLEDEIADITGGSLFTTTFFDAGIIKNETFIAEYTYFNVPNGSKVQTLLLNQFPSEVYAVEIVVSCDHDSSWFVDGYKNSSWGILGNLVPLRSKFPSFNPPFFKPEMRVNSGVGFPGLTLGVEKVFSGEINLGMFILDGVGTTVFHFDLRNLTGDTSNVTIRFIMRRAYD